MEIFKILKTKPEQNQDNILLYQNVSIYLGFIENKMELLLTISNIFFTSLERFCLLKAAQEQNKTFVFLTNNIKTKTKRFQLHQGLLKTKQNFWFPQKKIWKRTRTKDFGQRMPGTD